jgi:small redox-active disulfide protein 2
MKDVKVLGTGCAKCQELLSQTQRAVREIGLECTVQKVTDIREITTYGVMMTPALVVDGEIKVSGKVPSLEDLKKMLA